MIQNVVKCDICAGCGACSAICQMNAITLLKKSTFFPEVDPKKCDHCSICKKVCPSIKNNSFSIFKKNQINKGIKFNGNIGNFENIYLAYSRNNSIRYDASSGGVITTFLIYLLENKIIDAALLTYVNPENPTDSLIELVANKEDIINAKGSKYCPVPLCIGIRQIMRSEYEKIAIVGLGCHISAISNYQKLDKNFDEKIFIKLGITCGQCVTFDGLYHYLKQKDIDRSKIKTIKYRGGGWPGNIVIKTYDKEIKNSYMKFFEIFTWGFFEPKSCLLCKDFTNESADISFSDAWIRDVMEKDQTGTNIVITRNLLANELFCNASKEIYYEDLIPDKMISSMWWRFFTKKNLKLPIHKKYIFQAVNKIFYYNSYISRHLPIVAPIYINLFSIIYRRFRK